MVAAALELESTRSLAAGVLATASAGTGGSLGEEEEEEEEEEADEDDEDEDEDDEDEDEDDEEKILEEEALFVGSGVGPKETVVEPGYHST